MKAYNWVHCEDYIHILKRLRNPLINSKTEVSMLGIFYLMSKYEAINKKLNRSDVIVRDEMNVDSCLNLIDNDLLKEFEKLRNNLESNLNQSQNNAKGKLNTYIKNTYLENDETNLLSIEDYNNMSLEQLQTHLQETTELPDLTLQEEYFLVSKIYDYLNHTQIFYNTCHNEDKTSISEKVKKLIICIKFFDKQLDIISSNTIRGMGSILRMYKRVAIVFEEVQNGTFEIPEIIIERGIEVNSIDDEICSTVSFLNYQKENDCTISDTIRKVINTADYIEKEYTNLIMTSTISSNILELLFSILRAKTPNLCDYEFYCMLTKAIRINHIEHLQDSNRKFTLIKEKENKHYGRLNIKFKEIPLMPDNYKKSDKILRSQ